MCGMTHDTPGPLRPEPGRCENWGGPPVPPHAAPRAFHHAAALTRNDDGLVTGGDGHAASPRTHATPGPIPDEDDAFRCSLEPDRILL